MLRWRGRLDISRGFTLIELLLVIGLISILSGVGLRTFNKALARQKLSSQADRVVDFIQRAQNYARSGVMMNGTPVDAFYFQATAGAAAFSLGYQQNGNSNTLEGADLVSPVTFSGSSCGGTCQVSFSTPLARLTNGPSQTLRVCLTGVAYYNITVEASGKVSKSLLQAGNCP